MFTIKIIIGQQTTAVQVAAGTTARQVLEFLCDQQLISRFQGSYSLHFSGVQLSPDAPLGSYGIGPGDQLTVISPSSIGFGGGGKETLLQNLLKSSTKHK